MFKQRFLWAAAHEILPEQREELELTMEVVSLKEVNQDLWNNLVHSPEDERGLNRLAYELIKYANDFGFTLVQPAGSLLFQYCLGKAVEEQQDRWIIVLYAVSKRESIEKINEDGSVSKTSVFRHIKFVEL